MILFIIGDIILVLLFYIPLGAVTGAAVFTCMLVLTAIISGKSVVVIMKSRRRKLFLLYLLYIQVFIVILLTFLNREPGTIDEVNLRLFDTFSLDAYSGKFFIENIIMFIPFGVLLPLIWKSFMNIYRCMGAAIVISLLIESSQHLTKRGYFQTDDIVLNLAGMLAGYFLLNAAINIRKIRNRKRDYDVT